MVNDCVIFVLTVLLGKGHRKFHDEVDCVVPGGEREIGFKNSNILNWREIII